MGSSSLRRFLTHLSQPKHRSTCNDSSNQHLQKYLSNYETIRWYLLSTHRIQNRFFLFAQAAEIWFKMGVGGSQQVMQEIYLSTLVIRTRWGPKTGRKDKEGHDSAMLSCEQPLHFAFHWKTSLTFNLILNIFRHKESYGWCSWRLRGWVLLQHTQYLVRPESHSLQMRWKISHILALLWVFGNRALSGLVSQLSTEGLSSPLSSWLIRLLILNQT